ncbi:MAG: acetyl-CoA hydrolase/transferase family protein [Actinobacteria bacterium]|nr:acetyl-CoA hydrolase/transferase family protein [Actinomycetota bacterium]
MGEFPGETTAVPASSSTSFEPDRWVREGDTVVWGQAAAEPRGLTAPLLAGRHSIGPFRCFFAMNLSDTVQPEHADVVTFLSYTAAGSNRRLSLAGALEILPIHYSDYPRFFTSGRLPVDVVLLQVSPPDDEGRYSLGFADEYLSAALESARVVIGEVNEHAPRTSSRLLDADDFDLLVPGSAAPPVVEPREPNAVEREISRRVGELVADGSTLQTGIGSLPDAILAALADHTDLGLHSGSIGDRALDLIEGGAITNARKTIDPGFSVAAVLIGSERLYRFADDNPELLLRDTRYTHDPQLLAGQRRLVAINTAFEVDLTGQINAEVAGGRYLGAVGGSMDFLRGAARAEEGLPIIALPSTAGDSSRIVARLNGPVSTPRADAGVIVTEHGAVDLRGLTIAERRRRMIELVAPAHREGVEAEAAANELVRQ